MVIHTDAAKNAIAWGTYNNDYFRVEAGELRERQSSPQAGHLPRYAERGMPS